MDRFARQIIGYHGCDFGFAQKILGENGGISSWQPSENKYDWLGHGVYFWEHSPSRALRWAKERFNKPGRQPAVIGAVIQLGQCFDLLNEEFTAILGGNYQELLDAYNSKEADLPENSGREGKQRELDCLVINDCLERLKLADMDFDTVRGAFVEGAEVYPGAGFAKETHIQLAVKNLDCILGVFRPNLTL